MPPMTSAKMMPIGTSRSGPLRFFGCDRYRIEADVCKKHQRRAHKDSLEAERRERM